MIDSDPTPAQRHLLESLGFQSTATQDSHLSHWRGPLGVTLCYANDALPTPAQVMQESLTTARDLGATQRAQAIAKLLQV